VAVAGWRRLWRCRGAVAVAGWQCVEYRWKEQISAVRMSLEWVAVDVYWLRYGMYKKWQWQCAIPGRVAVAA
jgi:hypothetical protein